MAESFEDKRKRTAKRLGIDSQQIPRHIAIIMDGNGRWAQKRGLHRAKGHREGGKRVETIALHCVDVGVEYLTLYSFSMDNWKRPKEEIEALMYLYTRYLVGIRKMLKKNNVRLIHLGRLDHIPDELKQELAKTIELTSNNTGMILALALNYSSRTEIVDTVRKIAQNYKDGKIGIDNIDEECINNNLYTAGLADPDLLIRTANEMRVSNFLLWQISYTEFYVTDVFWPDFKEEDVDLAVKTYAERNRRFGSINVVGQ